MQLLIEINRSLIEDDDNLLLPLHLVFQLLRGVDV